MSMALATCATPRVFVGRRGRAIFANAALISDCAPRHAPFQRVETDPESTDARRLRDRLTPEREHRTIKRDRDHCPRCCPAAHAFRRAKGKRIADFCQRRVDQVLAGLSIPSDHWPRQRRRGMRGGAIGDGFADAGKNASLTIFLACFELLRVAGEGVENRALLRSALQQWPVSACRWSIPPLSRRR